MREIGVGATFASLVKQLGRYRLDLFLIKYRYSIH